MLTVSGSFPQRYEIIQHDADGERQGRNLLKKSPWVARRSGRRARFPGPDQPARAGPRRTASDLQAILSRVSARLIQRFD